MSKIVGRVLARESCHGISGVTLSVALSVARSQSEVRVLADQAAAADDESAGEDVPRLFVEEARRGRPQATRTMPAPSVMRATVTMWRSRVATGMPTMTRSLLNVLLG